MKTSNYGIALWILGFILYLLNPVYIKTAIADVSHIAIFLMVSALPYYLLSKYLEDKKE